MPTAGCSCRMIEFLIHSAFARSSEASSSICALSSSRMLSWYVLDVISAVLVLAASEVSCSDFAWCGRLSCLMLCSSLVG